MVNTINRFFTKVTDFVSSQRLLIAIIFFTFILRLPSLSEPLFAGDEAIYLTIGQKILRGGMMYVDIFDHKTPGIYYLTAGALGVFGQAVWSVKFLLTIWVLATLVAFYFLGKKLFNEKVALVATIIFSLLTSTPLIEGTIFNSEILMILPITLGVLAGLHRRFLLAGIFFSLAFLLKVPAVFDFAAFFIFAALTIKRDAVVKTIKNLLRLVSGFLIPIFLTIIYFIFTGGIGAYFKSAFLYNISYTGYGTRFIIDNGLLLIKAVPITLILIYFIVRVKQILRPKTKAAFSAYEFLIIWLILSFYGVLFGRSAFEHYLIQAVPAFSLVAAASFYNRSFARVGLTALLAVVSLTIVLNFQPQFNPTYYTNFFRFLGNTITFDQYAASFDAKTPRDYALASFLTGCEKYDPQNKCIRTRTSGDDKLYVFANRPSIYFLSGLNPASRYITFGHIPGDEEAKVSTAKAIAGAKPKYILVEILPPRSFPALEKLLSSRYNLFAFYEDVAIYKIKESTSR